MIKITNNVGEVFYALNYGCASGNVSYELGWFMAANKIEYESISEDGTIMFIVITERGKFTFVINDDEITFDDEKERSYEELIRTIMNIGVKKFE